MEHNAYVYIMTNGNHTTFYIGVTTDLPQRIRQHREGTGSIFVQKYKLVKLVYFEGFDRIIDAIAHEKRMKRWRRAWKESLIDKKNPNWEDLFEGLWYI
ncbi:GIY-YIG nuclease family protein [Pontibacter sp. G13]|uniref:GIY-YIG nuclease family protein n=1 Tax=Pontibacter sp. G13 TaxID=3074898 RepID=UPI00288A6121|nr:GIY-YIG nuclease family protein [Pontibacter sp. G13]WNJ20274.1 GIY-YIG nuclease family protein [Pontibacter sp. G13]